MKGDPLLTIKEATAHYFQGVTERRIRQLATTGTFGPLVKMGHKWLINETLLAKWLKAREVHFEPRPPRTGKPF